jgi:acyl carrier protein
MIANPRVLEAVSRLTGVPVEDLKSQTVIDVTLPFSMDSLDGVELVMDVADEFDDETVALALRYIELLARRSASEPEARHEHPRPPGGADPLWDDDLDSFGRRG